MTVLKAAKTVMLGMKGLFSGMRLKRTATYVPPGSRKKISFMPGVLWGVCGKSTQNFVHLVEKKFHRYVYPYELVCSLIGDLSPAVHHYNNGNTLVGGVLIRTWLPIQPSFSTNMFYRRILFNYSASMLPVCNASWWLSMTMKRMNLQQGIKTCRAEI